MGTASDFGKLVLRLTLGILTLLHGVGKIAIGPGSIMALFSAASLPPVLAYLVYVGEVFAPVLLIIGLWTRLAAMLVAINMAVAVMLVHTGALARLTETGGWALELEGFYFFVALAIVFLGAGGLSAGGENGRLN